MSAQAQPKESRARRAAIRLTAWLQEELAAQRRLDEVLAEQERAIREVDTGAMVTAGERVQSELKGGVDRERRRAGIMNELGDALGVDPRVLTLRSVGERMGSGTRESDALLRLRADLRSAAGQVARRGRRIAGLARYHAELFGELMQTLVGAEGKSLEEDGVLLDARG